MGLLKNITAARAKSGATFDHKFSGVVKISLYDRWRGVNPTQIYIMLFRRLTSNFKQMKRAGLDGK